jgi:hypothetical protein
VEELNPVAQRCDPSIDIIATTASDIGGLQLLQRSIVVLVSELS